MKRILTLSTLVFALGVSATPFISQGTCGRSCCGDQTSLKAPQSDNTCEVYMARCNSTPVLFLIGTPEKRSVHLQLDHYFQDKISRSEYTFTPLLTLFIRQEVGTQSFSHYLTPLRV